MHPAAALELVSPLSVAPPPELSPVVDNDGDIGSSLNNINNKNHYNNIDFSGGCHDGRGIACTHSVGSRLDFSALETSALERAGVGKGLPVIRPHQVAAAMQLWVKTVSGIKGLFVCLNVFCCCCLATLLCCSRSSVSC